MCRDDLTALDELDKATTGKQGKRTDLIHIVDNLHDVNNTKEKPAGTSTDAALRKLRKDAPSLHTRLENSESGVPGGTPRQELSPHAAAVSRSISGLLRLLCHATLDLLATSDPTVRLIRFGG